MEWRSDVGPARTGDSEARERLRDYLTPFAHAVCLAHAPHHLTFSLVPRSLDAALHALGGVEDADVGVHVMNVARRLSKELMQHAKPDELTVQDAAVNVALGVIGRLRQLDATLRERFLLRMLEGIPGPELAEVARAPAGELRAELERAAGEASRALGQAQSFAGDEYLWELSGAPSALLARLEMQLPVLRFDPLAVAPTPIAADTAGTQQELRPVGSAPPAKPRSFSFDVPDVTSVGDVATAPGEPGIAPVVAVEPQRPSGPNPFEPQVRTIAATDLPAEAKGQIPQVPWSEPAPSGSKSGKLAPLPARPVPSVRESGELSGKSGKSNSGKSGRQAQVEESGKKLASTSAKFPVEVTKDAPKLTDDDGVEATESKVPAAIARQSVVPDPEGMLGKPTMELSLAQAVPEATRLNPLIITNLETRVAEVPAAPPPAPSLADAQILKGGSPFFLVALFGLVGTGLWAATLFATERQSRASWTLTQVVVAAEDMNVGDVVNIENVAVRAVPEPFQGANVIKSDAMNFILDQKLAVAVQAGDPLFYSQFVSMRAQKNLATRVSKRLRGFTIATNVVSSVGRWVRPGDLVDLIVTLNALDTRDPKAKGRGKEPRSVTILQHVRVLATGKSAEDSEEALLDERDKQYGDVTLLLTAPEAEVLALASQLGKVSLTLRNEDDNEVDLTRGFTNIKTLLEGDRVRVLQKKRFDLIRFIRGAPAEPVRKHP